MSRPAFAIENSVENGGSEVSDTARSQIGQIDEAYRYASNALQLRRPQSAIGPVGALPFRRVMV